MKTNLTKLIIVGSVLLFGGGSYANVLYWAPGGGGTWDTATANWTGDSTVYADGGVDTVHFTNSAGGTITLSANRTPAAVFVTASGGTYTMSSASITGAGSLTKSGAGLLELRAQNSFTGGITLNGGEIDVDDLNRLGGTPLPGNAQTMQFTGNTKITVNVASGSGGFTYNPIIIDPGVTATFDRKGGATFPQYIGNISGDGAVTILSTLGNYTRFSGNNTFLGNLTISGGFGSNADQNLGDPNNITILNGGTFFPSLVAGISTYSASRTLQVNSGAIAPGNGAVWNGLVTGNGFTVVGGQGYGQPSLYLANPNNSFVGLLYVNTGTLEINTQGSLNGNNVTIGNSGGNGLRVSGTPNGNFTGIVRFEQGGGTYHFIDVVNAGATMNLTGALNTDTTANQSLRKYGQGTLTLNNAAGTYAGRMDVREGRLNINYSTPNLVGVVVSNGASFGGTGTINIAGGAPIKGDGSIDPGNSPGILTTAAVDPISVDGTLDFKFEFTKLDSPDYTNASASSNDVLRLTGASPFSGDTMTAANVISVYIPGNLLGGTNNFRGGFYTDQGDFLSSFSGATYQYFAREDGGPFVYNGLEYNWMTNVYPGSVMLVTSANETGTQFGGVDGFVTEFVGLGIPEPASAALLAAAGMLLWRRRTL